MKQSLISKSTLWRSWLRKRATFQKHWRSVGADHRLGRWGQDSEVWRSIETCSGIMSAVIPEPRLPADWLSCRFITLLSAARSSLITVQFNLLLKGKLWRTWQFWQEIRILLVGNKHRWRRWKMTQLVFVCFWCVYSLRGSGKPVYHCSFIISLRKKYSGLFHQKRKT